MPQGPLTLPASRNVPAPDHQTGGGATGPSCEQLIASTSTSPVVAGCSIYTVKGLGMLLDTRTSQLALLAKNYVRRFWDSKEHDTRVANKASRR